jgi:uncharacterized protein (DUF1800 family)
MQASKRKMRTFTSIFQCLALGGMLAAIPGAVAEPLAPLAPTAPTGHGSALRLPWKEAGLTERQAAAHLLNRFAFGPRPGEIDQVVALGLDRWIELQLAAAQPDPNLDARLQALPALSLAEADIVRVYPTAAQILAQARKEGVLTEDEVIAAKADKAAKNLYAKDGKAGAGAGAGADSGLDLERPELRAKLLAFARSRGYRPERELMAQLQAQKLFRAAEARNQLQEVMTDFWFNHFNVSQTNGRARPYLLSYERDAIRPNALGAVRGLLDATARHPAMLLYLDNAESTAAPNAPTLLGDEVGMRRAARFGGAAGTAGAAGATGAKGAKRAKPHGLNENYARELMELHTLGVDGGYSQKDVVEVARAFTGWTVLPTGPAREAAERRLERARQYGGLGFRTDGDFLFRADMHDSGVKNVLGYQLPAGRGIEDGEAVLTILARHPATALHLSTQLAVRFVSDKPPAALIARLVATYGHGNGDIREMLRTLVQSPEFWSRDAVGAKVKSPFELAVSAVRAAGAHVEEPRALLAWISRMGEPLYAYQAPTGYPDRADAWVNTGSLLNRMNFGLQFAAQRIAGLDMDLPALRDGHEPESREEALRVYAALMLPGRDLGTTIRMLTPMVSDPGLVHRIDEAAPKAAASTAAAVAAAAARGEEGTMAPAVSRGGGGAGDGGGGGGRRRQGELVRAARPQHPPTPVEQVVGLILGSPEFQRR